MRALDAIGCILRESIHGPDSRRVHDFPNCRERVRLSVCLRDRRYIMSLTTFDTLKFAQRLEKAGLEREQAVAFAEAQKEAFAETIETQLATKGDIRRVEQELLLLKWMIGFNLAFTMAVVWRIFS